MTMNPPSGWTDERVEILKTSWLEGLSAAQLAKKLGQGVSRNAVISKLHRLGLTGVDKPNRKEPSAPRRAALPKAPRPASDDGRLPAASRAQKAVTLQASAAALAAPAALPGSVDLWASGEAAVLTLDLCRHHCRWPVGMGGGADQLYCGARRQDGATYCPGHTLKAFKGGKVVTEELVRGVRWMASR